MAAFHSRSNSFPSSHPSIEDVEAQLCRLRSSEATSTSASSVCANLANLGSLHESIKDLIQMSSIQQVLSHQQGQNQINELLEGSIKLVDLCEFSREALCLTKESVQDLESAIRRNKGESIDISSYIASRNKIKKMIHKYIKNLKSCTGLDSDLKPVGTMLKEAEGIDFSVLKSVLILLSGERERSNGKSWSFLSKFNKTSQVHSERAKQESGVEDLCSLNIHQSQKKIDNITMQNMLKQLKATELIVQELEEGVEALFRSLVKTRVSLLNMISH
ncbi:uncharacterized protein LOC127246560 [Andrographis paniculata]|uniref:uncharacterized protein LOC127246560 n=1 Tax=Andrographis paniculata TaxID=175694 RepID=UPI0021E8B258|nr:uncharacterized protein LOC127246560 [Andrographis paniculata]